MSGKRHETRPGIPPRFRPGTDSHATRSLTWPLTDACPEELVLSASGSPRSCGHDFHSAGISLALSSIVQT
ncbi:hypothetical protein Taro_051039, partial [Colocasia esculenta]|nr:hypothetical protein [Colocasia esculenta]